MIALNGSVDEKIYDEFRRPSGTHFYLPRLPGAERAGLFSNALPGRKSWPKNESLISKRLTYAEKEIEVAQALAFELAGQLSCLIDDAL
jgi:hypothetical protein